jgi:hypothetical protein
MVVGMKMMGVRRVSVVRRLLVFTRFVVLGRLLVMTGRVFEMFGSLRVMLRGLGHSASGSSFLGSGLLVHACCDSAWCGTEASSRLSSDDCTLNPRVGLSIWRAVVALNLHESRGRGVEPRHRGLEVVLVIQAHPLLSTQCPEGMASACCATGVANVHTPLYG